MKAEEPAKRKTLSDSIEDEKIPIYKGKTRDEYSRIIQ